MQSKKYPYTYEYFKARLNNLASTIRWYKSECELWGCFNREDLAILGNLSNTVFSMERKETESVRDHISRIAQNEYMLQVDDMGRYLQEKYLPVLFKAQATKQKRKDGL